MKIYINKTIMANNIISGIDVVNFISKNGPLNEKYVTIIILGDGAGAKITNIVDKETHKINQIISIDPYYEGKKYTHMRKRVRLSMRGLNADDYLLLEIRKGNKIILISLNSHTHANKFFTRLTKLKVPVYAFVMVCHFQGLIKRNITKVVKTGYHCTGCTRDLQIHIPQ